jgi:hypothetical protein
MLTESEDNNTKPISLSEEAEKRRLMMQVNGIKLSAVPFAESKIFKVRRSLGIISVVLQRRSHCSRMIKRLEKVPLEFQWNFFKSLYHSTAMTCCYQKILTFR